MDIPADQKKRLDELAGLVTEDELNRYADADGGLASILSALTTRYAGRFKAPIASIELMEQVVGIDVLNTGSSITVTDLYRMLYILDAGPSALQHVIKAQEKLKLVNRLEGFDREKVLDEIAQAEADLTLAATEYYRKHFAEADQIQLANELVSAINGVYLAFAGVEPAPVDEKDKNRNVKKKNTDGAGLWQSLKRWARFTEPSRM